MGEQAWRRVARVEEVEGSGPFAASAGDVDVVLVRTPSGALKAFEGLCPHRGALLGEGELHGDTLVCRNHRWRFDTATGRRDGGKECLAACEVRETGGEVHVDVGALLRKRDTKTKARRRLDDLPGPRRLPLIGNVHQLDPDRLHLTLGEWGRIHGTPYHYRFGPKDVVVFDDIDEMLPVLRDRPDTFRRASNLEPIFRELGVAGVFSAEGKAWRPQRRLSMEALSHRHLRGLYPTLGIIASRLRDRWLKAADRGDTLDLGGELKRFTVDVTTQLVLGHDIDTLGTDGGVIQDKLALLFPTFNRRLFSLVPWWRLVRLPHDRAVDRVVAELREWVGTLVRDARARMAADAALAARPANFLEAMIVARDENGEPFGEDTIFGNVLTMLLAGEDTTAHTLAWAVHHLLDAPSEISALREELDRVMGGEPVPRDIETASAMDRSRGAGRCARTDRAPAFRIRTAHLSGAYARAARDEARARDHLSELRHRARGSRRRRAGGVLVHDDAGESAGPRAARGDQGGGEGRQRTGCVTITPRGGDRRTPGARSRGAGERR